MTIAGATSPVTLAGTVVQGLAEFLGVATAMQVAAPGAKLVFCFGSGVLDMLRTTFSHGLRRERPHGRDGHRGGPLPRRARRSTPGSRPTPSTPASRPATRRPSRPRTVCSANPDIVSGWGLIDSHNTMYLPQSVVDNEIAAMVRRLSARSRSRQPRWRRLDRQGRAGRRLPRRKGHGAAHPRRRAPHCRASRPALLREVGRGGSNRERHGERTRSSASSRRTPPRSPCLTDEQLDDLAADLPRSDGESVRRARRGSAAPAPRQRSGER